MGPKPNSCGNNIGGVEQRGTRGCFNGATANQLWKLTREARRIEPTTPASMGPQPNSCGNHLGRAWLFGGRMLQWGHSQTAVETRKSRSPHSALQRLQWGHSQTAVETDQESKLIVWGARASMGPQPNSCGNAYMTLVPSSSVPGFNGATAKQLWKPIAEMELGRRSSRFNGATAKQLWKHNGNRRLILNEPSLQWGHSQTAVETRGARDRAVVGHEASMGPQPNSCGNVYARTRTGRLRVAPASMGPQPNSCGNRARTHKERQRMALQWGHSQTAVETIPPANDFAVFELLQWGHSQTAVETRSNDDEGVPAGMLQWGHSQTAVETSYRNSKQEAVEKRLQWGHSQTAVETYLESWVVFGTIELQWGHSQTAVETHSSELLRSRPPSLQWGHSQTAVETA